MMSNFLFNNREELIGRCATKVAMRPKREATEQQLSNGVPLFLAQLQRTLEAEEHNRPVESRRISGASGASGGEDLVTSEMGVGATAHGRQLMDLGYSVDQVVHDYGDLCQAITDLAFERDAPFAVDEFRTLNRCLDNAIASAVSAFSAQRDASSAARQDAEMTERLHLAMFELRSSLATATYAVAALELGNLPVTGATGSVLKRSLEAMRAQVGGPTLDEVLTQSDSGTEGPGKYR
jgi:hypothetical protein